MSRRILSTAVQVRPPTTNEERLAAALEGRSLYRAMPSEPEMRDAIARVTRDLEDMVRERQAGQDGWKVEDLGPDNFMVTTTAEGEVILRGTILMSREERA